MIVCLSRRVRHEAIGSFGTAGELHRKQQIDWSRSLALGSVMHARGCCEPRPDQALAASSWLTDTPPDINMALKASIVIRWLIAER